MIKLVGKLLIYTIRLGLAGGVIYFLGTNPVAWLLAALIVVVLATAGTRTR